MKDAERRDLHGMTVRYYAITTFSPEEHRRAPIHLLDLLRADILAGWTLDSLVVRHGDDDEEEQGNVMTSMTAVMGQPIP